MTTNTVPLPSDAGQSSTCEAHSAAAACRRGVVAVNEDLEASAAWELMRDHENYLVVTEPSAASNHHIVGILTQDNIAEVVRTRPAEAQALSVADFMARPSLIIDAHQSLESVPDSMHQAGVTCAPVVGVQGELIGILWLSDVVKTLQTSANRSA